MAAESPKVKSIFIYPIKSCHGISVPQAPISATGFRWDRQWLVVNGRGRGYTQRVEPKLALVESHFPTEAFSDVWKPTKSSYFSTFQNRVIKAPGMTELKVLLSKKHVISDNLALWRWSGSALDEGDEAAKWFTEYMGKPSRLVRFNEVSETRAVDPLYANGHKIAFSDEFPFLLASQGSLDEVNKRLEDPIPINRFRPNILVDGCEPFSEDLWTEMKINTLTFHSVKLCARCKVTTVDQENAVVGSEPIKTLKSFRSDIVLRPNKKNKGLLFFGQNLVCEETVEGKGKMVKVGDSVCVLKMVSSREEAAV